ncbi:MAG TPA: hypothetical protein VEY51_00615, partial [Chondromyces sp.]|nr:hypothetical protein [Chondromyces sp.]
MVFYVIYAFLILQRFVELIIARRNERWMKKQGAEEYGQGHYPFMVLMHVAFFIVLFFEVMA